MPLFSNVSNTASIRSTIIVNNFLVLVSTPAHTSAHTHTHAVSSSRDTASRSRERLHAFCAVACLFAGDVRSDRRMYSMSYPHYPYLVTTRRYAPTPNINVQTHTPQHARVYTHTTLYALYRPTRATRGRRLLLYM
jgi:hypothetical protein